MKFLRFSAFALAGLAPFAHAGLLGNVVDVHHIVGSSDVDLGNQVAVDPGVEYPNAFGGSTSGASIDLTDTTFELTLSAPGGKTFADGAFNGWSIATIPGQTGSKVVGSWMVSGVSPKSMFLDGTTLYLDYRGVTFAEGDKSIVYVQTWSTVPEPASFAALGVGALALLRRRKRA